MFYPAAGGPVVRLVPVAFFVLATGIVDPAGGRESVRGGAGQARDGVVALTLTQAFNSLATCAFPRFIGPLILVVAVLSAAERAL